MLLTDYDVALRSDSFALEGRWFLWSRVRLYADRIVLTGWSLTGPYRRVIPMAQIHEGKVDGEHLVLVLAEEASLRIQVDAPEEWVSAIATYRDFRDHGGADQSQKDGSN